jgi:hypothetical protein
MAPAARLHGGCGHRDWRQQPRGVGPPGRGPALGRRRRRVLTWRVTLSAQPTAAQGAAREHALGGSKAMQKCVGCVSSSVSSARKNKKGMLVSTPPVVRSRSRPGPVSRASAAHSEACTAPTRLRTRSARRRAAGSRRQPQTARVARRWAAAEARRGRGSRGRSAAATASARGRAPADQRRGWAAGRVAARCCLLRARRRGRAAAPRAAWLVARS